MLASRKVALSPAFSERNRDDTFLLVTLPKRKGSDDGVESFSPQVIAGFLEKARRKTSAYFVSSRVAALRARKRDPTMIFYCHGRLKVRPFASRIELHPHIATADAGVS